VNSIDAVKDAIEKEIERQKREYEAGRKVEAWTLEWDEDTQTLKKMRSKETEADYRYFREPDLLPVKLDEAWKSQILSSFPELPLDRRVRFILDYGLPEYDAEILTGERSLADYFEDSVKIYGGDPKKISNWLINDVMRMMNAGGISARELKLTPRYLSDVVKLVDSNAINSSTGKSLLEKINSTGKSPNEIVSEEGLAKVSDDQSIRMIVNEVLAESPQEVANYKAGKITLMGWFVGQVMKKMRGKADPQVAKTILEEMLM
jgi:aspartyl-tRNA(Asn)/glutamyl-tRNA(Gln) amidotransferase subunit B